MSSIHLPNIVKLYQRNQQKKPAEVHKPGLLWSRCSSCEKHPPMGTPKIAPFPYIRPYSLLHIAQLRPDPRPGHQLCPLSNRGRPTNELRPHQPAASSATIPPPPRAARLNRRARRPNSPQQLLLRSFRMRVFHQPVPLLSGAWFYSTSTTSLAFIFRGGGVGTEQRRRGDGGEKGEEAD